MNIRIAQHKELQHFFIYLEDQLSANGQQGQALFQPLSREESQLSPELKTRFEEGLNTPIGQDKWRRLWLAVDDQNRILGHIDIRAHPEKHTQHRALLGIGIDRQYRRQGLGTKLINTMQSWVKAETNLEYIDLWVISSNQAAQKLYLKTGFKRCGEIIDMFRIDKQSISYTLMCKCIH